MNRYASCQDELIMFSYLCGTVYVASFCVFSGELVPGIVFLHDKVRTKRANGNEISTLMSFFLHLLGEMDRVGYCAQR